MSRYLNDPAEIDRILAKGADAATAIADPIIADVRDIMGFWKA